ncbi:hypothetical protein ADUPG1_008096, partial [Aduncisulcus paluster]
MSESEHSDNLDTSEASDPLDIIPVDDALEELATQSRVQEKASKIMNSEHYSSMASSLVHSIGQFDEGVVDDEIMPTKSSDIPQKSACIPPKEHKEETFDEDPMDLDADILAEEEDPDINEELLQDEINISSAHQPNSSPHDIGIGHREFDGGMVDDEFESPMVHPVPPLTTKDLREPSYEDDYKNHPFSTPKSVAPQKTSYFKKYEEQRKQKPISHVQLTESSKSRTETKRKELMRSIAGPVVDPSRTFLVGDEAEERVSGIVGGFTPKASTRAEKAKNSQRSAHLERSRKKVPSSRGISTSPRHPTKLPQGTTPKSLRPSHGTPGAEVSATVLRPHYSGRVSSPNRHSLGYPGADRDMKRIQELSRKDKETTYRLKQQKEEARLRALEEKKAKEKNEQTIKLLQRRIADKEALLRDSPHVSDGSSRIEGDFDGREGEEEEYDHHRRLDVSNKETPTTALWKESDTPTHEYIRTFFLKTDMEERLERRDRKKRREKKKKASGLTHEEHGKVIKEEDTGGELTGREPVDKDELDWSPDARQQDGALYESSGPDFSDIYEDLEQLDVDLSHSSKNKNKTDNSNGNVMRLEGFEYKMLKWKRQKDGRQLDLSTTGSSRHDDERSCD